MARKHRYYVDLRGTVYSLEGLDAESKRLIARLERRAQSHPDWNDFDNYWSKQVTAFYDARGYSRKEARQTIVYKIAQDLSNRLGIQAGLVKPFDYRGEMAEIIRENFHTRRKFCEATGLSEDMVSHVLAGRKHLSIDSLQKALEKIGYTLHITPREGMYDET